MTREELKRRIKEALREERVEIYNDDEVSNCVLLGTIATNKATTDAHELVFEFMDDGSARLVLSCREICMNEECPEDSIKDTHGSWEDVLQSIEQLPIYCTQQITA